MSVPGKGLLKVASVLFIIFGAIATIIPAMGLIVYATRPDSLAELAGVIIITMILILAVSTLHLILGIVGLKKCGDASKGRCFMTAGIILCALSFVSLTLCIAGASFNASILGVPMGVLAFAGIALPILYIIGGAMNRNAVPPVA